MEPYLLVIPGEERMRDMTLDELDLFEEEIVQGSERREEDRRPPSADEPLRGEVTPDDDDGLPDGPAKYRVPS